VGRALRRGNEPKTLPAVRRKEKGVNRDNMPVAQRQKEEKTLLRRLRRDYQKTGGDGSAEDKPGEREKRSLR